MTVCVLNTPSWTPRQSMLAALEDCEDMEFCVIAFKKKDGTWDSIISNITVPELHFLGALIQRRAYNAMESW